MWLLGKDIFGLVTSVGKKKILSPHKESNLRASMLYHWATDSMVSEVYYEVRRTRVSHTAKITNVDSVLIVNSMREMVSFELGTEMEKDLSLFFSSCHETRQKTCFNSVNNWVENVNWPPRRVKKGDVSSVSPSSERLEELWVVCGFLYWKWSYAIGGSMVTRKREKLVEWKALVNTVGIKCRFRR